MALSLLVESLPCPGAGTGEPAQHTPVRDPVVPKAAVREIDALSCFPGWADREETCSSSNMT